ncbi:MAG: hypothetical protein R3Y53_07260, partial [Bacillota bacterium]
NLFNNGALDEIANNTGAIASNTGSAADSLANSETDWEMFRNLADRQFSQQVANITIETNLGGISNNVNTEADIDGIISQLTKGVEQAMQKSMEGVRGELVMAYVMYLDGVRMPMTPSPPKIMAVAVGDFA